MGNTKFWGRKLHPSHVHRIRVRMIRTEFTLRLSSARSIDSCDSQCSKWFHRSLVMASIYFGINRYTVFRAHIRRWTITTTRTDHTLGEGERLSRRTIKCIVAIRFYINNLYRLRVHRTSESGYFQWGTYSLPHTQRASSIVYQCGD